MWPFSPKHVMCMFNFQLELPFQQMLQYSVDVVDIVASSQKREISTLDVLCLLKPLTQIEIGNQKRPQLQVLASQSARKLT